MQYLITDIRTLAQTWVTAESVRCALIKHENNWRRVKLPDNTKASVYANGDLIDVSLGESACRGVRADIVRNAG
jgi:hypothetical protein